MENGERTGRLGYAVGSPFTILGSPLLLILADDLTGAADCAARCRHAGLGATILLNTESNALSKLPSGALAFTSDSRHLAPPAAAERVRAVMDAVKAGLDEQLGRGIWYKKIDSTLRGNLGSELDAMLDALAGVDATPRRCVISPAFPAQGRGLDGGYLVHAQTPARTVHLPSLLASQSRRSVVGVQLAGVRQGSAHLGQLLAALQADGHELTAVDALSESDLETVFVAAQQTLPSVLFCGSAGLVGVIARHIAAAQSAPIGIGHDEPPICSVLAVVGSGSEMAHRQLVRLRQEPKAQLVQVDAMTQPASVAAEATDARCVALHLPRPAPGTPLEGDAARRMADQLAESAVAWLSQRSVDALILVGGDTAIGVLTRLGIDQLAVVSEVLPGMPLTRARLADGRWIRVILKAGNHGDDRTLATLALHS